MYLFLLILNLMTVIVVVFFIRQILESKVKVCMFSINRYSYVILKNICFLQKKHI